MSKTTEPAEYQGKLVGPLAIIFDLGLAAVFFLFMWYVAYGHTPDFSQRGKLISGAFCSLCLTGVFWLCVQGFRVTLTDQLRRKKAGIPS
jgi:hypothetical protein